MARPNEGHSARAVRGAVHPQSVTKAITSVIEELLPDTVRMAALLSRVSFR
jgi:hypothetical protein